MKYDLDELRVRYESALKKRSSDSSISAMTIKEALQTLDDVLSEIKSSRNDLIDNLATGSEFLHFCGGKAKQLGHKFYEPQGGLSFHPGVVVDGMVPYIKSKAERLGLTRRAFLLYPEEAWEGYPFDISSHQFEAIIRGSSIGTSYAFRMYWVDNTYDHRDGSHVGYALLVPSNKSEEVTAKVAADPHVLISVFQAVFPEYDNSNGSLKISRGSTAIRLGNTPS